MTTKHHDDDDLTLAIEICESSNGTISNMSNPVSAAMRHRDDSLLLMNPTPQTAVIDPQSVKKRMHLRRDSHSSRRTLRSSTMCCGTNSMSAALGMLFLIVGGVLLSCAAVSTVRTVAVIHTAPGAPTTRVLYPYIQIEISKRPNDQSSWFKDSLPAPRTLIAPYYTPPAPPTYPSISFGQDYVPLTTSSSAYRGHCVKPDGTWASGDLFPPYILRTNLNNPEDNATPPAGSASP